jgi:uncharacterized protein (DUF1800 family)
MPRFLETAMRVHTRFGFGARPGEPLPRDPHGAVVAQLTGAVPARPRPPEADDATVLAAYRAFGVAANPRGADAEMRQRAQAEARRTFVRLGAAEGTSALAQRVRSERPFVERLIAFWSDHLAISTAGKAVVAPLAGRYEREVIRAHVLGRFDEMVLASARHPAMLLYLDNAQSIGPNSRAVQRARQVQGRRGGGEAARAVAQRGLNENYARELLELHTLGVDGGYTQRDVTELARLLTGWTAAGVQQGRIPQFEFAAPRHELGTKRILGARYGDGEAEGVRAIRALCRHPSTATHVARKLAVHFIADDPPADAVERLAKVFRDTEGDLRAVSAALVREPGCWDERYRKFRTPQDWLVAAFRHFGIAQVPPQAVASLRELRQPLWAPPAPKGYGDLERDWADPDGLLNRAELARTMARRIAPRRADDLALEIAGPAFQWR